MKSFKLIALLMLSALISCGPYKINNPYQFFLNKQITDIDEISGYNMSHIDSVEAIGANSVILHSGGIVAMMVNDVGITQLMTDYTTEIISGYGIRFVLRSLCDAYPNHPSITFDFTIDGCTVNENNKLIVKVDSIKAKMNTPARIIIENYGKSYNIIVDCDTVYYGRTELYGTEHSIIQTLNGSEAKLTGIVFSNMNSDIMEFIEWQPESEDVGEK